MNIYLVLDERSIIRNVVAHGFRVVAPNYIPYHELDLTLVGMKWDAQTQTAVENPYPEPVIISKTRFRNLFTIQEKVEIYTAAKEDPVIQVFLDDVLAADDIDLSFPPLILGVNYLVQEGIITQGRAAQILSNQEP